MLGLDILIVMLRKDPFITGEYYHIYNRGVDKRVIFKSKNDYERFVMLLYIANSNNKTPLRLDNLINHAHKNFSEVLIMDKGQVLLVNLSKGHLGADVCHMLGALLITSITSAATILQMLSLVSYSFSWAGSSPVGIINVQVSNDFSLDAGGGIKNAGTWNTVTVEINGTTLSDIPVTGSTGTGFIDITATAAYAMRVVYTRTSGSGTLQAILAAKVA